MSIYGGENKGSRKGLLQGWNSRWLRQKEQKRKQWVIVPSNAYFSHELCMDLGHPVDGPGSLSAEIRGWVPGRRGSKSSNRAGHKQSQIVFCGNIQNIMQSWNQQTESECKQISYQRPGKTGKQILLDKTQRLTSDIYGSGQRYVCFSNRTEQSTVMEQPGDAVVYHNLSEILVIQNVGINKWACKETSETAEVKKFGVWGATWTFPLSPIDLWIPLVPTWWLKHLATMWHFSYGRITNPHSWWELMLT